jgi:hypothetical protein
MITFEFTFGAGDKASTRQIAFDPEDITLGFLEDVEAAQDTGKWAPIRTAIAGLLGLTADESRQITMRQFKQLGEAIRVASEAQSVPKA